ncbi:hypothetical protein ASPWEDRAFT_162529 [Aspergillus wentii DTO 134E9]|uniref:Uncharacterized protein n=1 Tax=Aspergillus wentii DTO 134E9 TaxID=1073089 RepID=A0A1L9R7Q1_ASPWE|nr:uncharacterized protein ASPWEDRAFT_162529 [Aspergillus wentii DTO 134E9]KAI9927566.1 hypothetical protein MW887_003184 [Aspergillus wentii]OJJ30941.1 hypothetical protein ASPWEDRAFT_162529 [Aspergillus wentii DTO 134E9]
MGSFTNKEVEIDNVISGLSQIRDDLVDGCDITPEQRKQLIEVCDDVSSRSKPRKLEFQLIETTAVRIAIDLKIFELACSGSKKEFTLNEFASNGNADPVLVERIMRSLVVTGLFSATSRNTYKANDSVRNLGPDGSMKDMVIFVHDATAFVSLKLPEFLAKTNYQNPNDADYCPFQFAFNTPDRFYTWLQKRPTLYSAFCGMMKCTEDQGIRWPDMFPAEERFTSFRGPSAKETLRLVDIAGGTGHNLQYLLDKIPDLRIEPTLQDLPEVLQNKPADLHPTIHVMPHNFFEPQPVKGAHVYVLRRILHNWPDKECRKILGHVRDAMDSHSILLIGDKVFPDGAAEINPADVTMDMVMMMLFGSIERTESQSRELLASAGLDLVRIWRVRGEARDEEGVLEVVKRG